MAPRTIRTPSRLVKLRTLSYARCTARRRRHPTLFLPAGFQLAITVLPTIVPVRLYYPPIRAYRDI
jgi:hypothetical protein